MSLSTGQKVASIIIYTLVMLGAYIGIIVYTLPSAEEPIKHNDMIDKIIHTPRYTDIEVIHDKEYHVVCYRSFNTISCVKE